MPPRTRLTWIFITVLSGGVGMGCQPPQAERGKEDAERAALIFDVEAEVVAGLDGTETFIAQMNGEEGLQSNLQLASQINFSEWEACSRSGRLLLQIEEVEACRKTFDAEQSKVLLRARALVEGQKSLEQDELGRQTLALAGSKGDLLVEVKAVWSDYLACHQQALALTSLRDKAQSLNICESTLESERGRIRDILAPPASSLLTP